MAEIGKIDWSASRLRANNRSILMEVRVDILFSSEFLSALAAIVVIDLVLAGDNAIVIALAARGLPAHLQKRAVIWGTVGAIIVRSLMTVAVVWLLKIPGLMLIGGALLIWIACKLLMQGSADDEAHGPAAATFWGAMKTIVIADAVMGLDNVLAVAGAAHGSYLLVVLGLLISIPIVIWGSTLILKWVERYPSIVYLGAAVLAWTAAKMMTSEPMVQPMLEEHTWAAHAFTALVVGGVMLTGYLRQRANAQRASTLLPVSGDITMPAAFSAHPESGDTNMQRILIPVDGSPNAELAVRHVMNQFMADSNREIHLLNVQPLLSRHIARGSSSRDRAAWRRSESDRALAGARDLLTRHGVPHAAHSRAGDFGQVIADEARRLKCDRIVMTTARKNPLTRGFQHSVTNSVLEQATVPVELVTVGRAGSLERWGVPAAAGGLLALVLSAID